MNEKNKYKGIIITIVLVLLLIIAYIITNYLYMEESNFELANSKVTTNQVAENVTNTVSNDIQNEEKIAVIYTNTAKENEDKIQNEEMIEKEIPKSNVSKNTEKTTNNNTKESKTSDTSTNTQNDLGVDKEVNNSKTSENTKNNTKPKESTNTVPEQKETIENLKLANTHFVKYNATKTKHAIDYINDKIKQDELYEMLGGKAIAVKEKPTDFWFSYSGDFKLDGVCIAGLIVKVYVEDEYVYDSKGINYYLYDTKAYIYQTQE